MSKKKYVNFQEGLAQKQNENRVKGMKKDKKSGYYILPDKSDSDLITAFDNEKSIWLFGRREGDKINWIKRKRKKVAN